MSHAVCEPCVDCKYTDCVSVCPVNCFYEAPDKLLINFDECIDCTACVPECPVEAIFAEGDVPEKWQSYIEINRTEAPQFPNISVKKEALLGPKCVPKQG